MTGCSCRRSGSRCEDAGLQTPFAGGPSSILAQLVYDGGVADLLKGWDDFFADPEFQALLVSQREAGIAPAASSTWARIPL